MTFKYAKNSRWEGLYDNPQTKFEECSGHVEGIIDGNIIFGQGEWNTTPTYPY